MPTLLTPQLQSFAKLGRIVSAGVANFADPVTVTEPEVLAELQNFLSKEAGNIDRLFEVTVEGDVFKGKAEQRVGLNKSQTYNFLLSPRSIQYKLINAVEMAEYAESEEGWADIIEFATTAKTRKKLNCKAGNVQCGGKCQSGKFKCSKNPTPAQAATLTDLAAKATAKPKTTTAKAKPEAIAKPVEKPAAITRENTGTHKDIPSADPSNIKVKGEKEFKSYSFKKNGDAYEYFETRKLGSKEETRPILANEYKAALKNEFEGSWQKAKFGKDFLSEAQRQEYDSKYQALQQNQVEAVSRLSNISESETAKVIAAVKDFSEDGYTSIRNAERGNFADDLSEAEKEELTSKVESINKLIKTAPTFKGDIHRGMNFRSKEDLEAFIALTTESGVELSAMSSFSSKVSVAREFAEVSGSFASGEGGDYGAIITVRGNKSGVSIKNLSVSPEEDEVLVPRGSRYRLVSVSGTGKLKKIEMEEISE